MKAVIFSGGSGLRFWPISRLNKPKTVVRTFNNQSFLEMTVARLSGFLPPDDIFIATGRSHKKALQSQVPQIPKANLILEPQVKDTAMAVANAAKFIFDRFPDEPLGIFWSDHVIKDIETFKKGFEIACLKVKETKKMVYYETYMRFPDVNLGYVAAGKKLESFGDKVSLFEFKSFLEKPDLATAKKYFRERGKFFWNTGYLVTTPRLLLEKYEEYAPQIFNLLRLPVEEAFERAEKLSFDFAIAEKLKSKDCLVLVADMGWHEVGEWVMVKEAFEESARDNVVIKGLAEFLDSTNSLAYGQDKKIIAVVGLNDVGVIDTKDALLVLNLKDSNKIKSLVNFLREEGLDNYT